MSCFNHFTIKDREEIKYFVTLNKSFRWIANKINFYHTSISREISRNTVNGEYLPYLAQERADSRRRQHKPKNKLIKYHELRRIVHDRLVYDNWSPEQISGRLKLENYPVQISFSAIYRAITCGHGLEPANTIHLRIKHRRIGKKKTVNEKNHIIRTIHQRPEEANNRTEIGHWEGDLILVPLQKKSILTLVDRKSRYTVTGLIDSSKPDSEMVRAVVKSCFDKINLINPLNPVKSISKIKKSTLTLDRGSEFAKIYLIEKNIKIETYFCDPYSPWQRGTNENTNGLLRYFYPKRSVSYPLTEETLDEFTAQLNRRPRKCLDFRSSYESFFDCPVHFIC